MTVDWTDPQISIEVPDSSVPVIDVPSPAGVEILVVQGKDGAGVNLAGAVATYADLPSTLGAEDAGAAYVVQGNGKLYVWSGTAWPSEPNGADFRGEQGLPGVGIDGITLAGADLVFDMSEGANKVVPIPAITAAAQSASDAAAARDAAAGSALAAAGSASDANTDRSAAEAARDDAQDARDAAAGSASAASGSASTATGAASTATAARDDAEDARDAAQSAQSDAEDARDAASGSASAAAGSASAASIDAGTASDAASDAEDARDAASGSASAASGSASAASTAANTATTAASDAEDARDLAAGSASAASGSASAASGSAGDAASSATASAGSALAAAGSESNAAASETNAGTSESNAASSELAAAGYASAAAGSASTATTAAEDAEHWAGEAAEAVNTGVPNASASMKGGIMLPGSAPGELGGTYDHPTVTGWADKADLVGGKIPSSQIPAIATIETFVVTTSAERLGLAVQRGDIAVQTGNPGRGTYILQGDDPADPDDWVMLAVEAAVSSVNGYTGIVVLSQADVGLGNVDNTADVSKPVSGPQQTALDAKLDKTTTANRVYTTGADGAQSLRVLSSDGEAWTVPIRGNGGVLKVAPGVAAGDAATKGQLDTAIGGVVPSARTITAGTGLSGGGSLAQNRTLAVEFGTTAGTAVEGNDERVVNAASVAHVDARPALWTWDGNGTWIAPDAARAGDLVWNTDTGDVHPIVGETGAVWSTPGFQDHWVPALRASRPARILVISDSMAEMVDGVGIAGSWPNLLGDRIFLPAQSSWGRGANPNDGGGSVFPHPYHGQWTSGSYFIDGELGPIRPVRVGFGGNDGGGQSSGDASYVAGQPLIVKAAWSSFPQISFGTNYQTVAADFAQWNGAASGDGILLGPKRSRTGGATQFDVWVDSGELVHHGVFLDKTAAPTIEVMNLSRAGITSAQWLEWLGNDYIGDSMAGLAQGFDPDLIMFGSWGNDFWEAPRPNEAQVGTRLSNLKARLEVLCPNADFFGWTNPSQPGAWATSADWATFNGWIGDWYDAHGIPFLDWHSEIPAAADPAYYASDEIHPKPALSALIADLTAALVLPQEA